MRERYFRMYESLKYKECFYAAHDKRAHKRYNYASCITLAVSIISVLVWSISKTMPTLWAIIIAAAQFLQTYSVNLPYSKQIATLKYLLPALNDLLLQVDREWLSIDVEGYDEQKIASLVSAYERKYVEIENQFVRDVEFGEIKSVLEKAEKDQAAFFQSRYTYTTTERSEQVNA